MSKSLGNTLTIEALLKRHDPEALRLYLQTHYRNPVEFTEEGVAGMRRPLERFRELGDAFRELVDEAGRRVPTDDAEPEGGRALRSAVAAHRERFEAAMDDDFNTPQAIGALNQLTTTLAEEQKRVRAGARSEHDFAKASAS